jgi:hypothetical protein
MSVELFFLTQRRAALWEEGDFQLGRVVVEPRSARRRKRGERAHTIHTHKRVRFLRRVCVYHAAAEPAGECFLTVSCVPNNFSDRPLLTRAQDLYSAGVRTPAALRAGDLNFALASN